MALALGPKSLALALALIPQGLGLGLDLVSCVLGLGLGLGSQVLVNITAVISPARSRNRHEETSD